MDLSPIVTYAIEQGGFALACLALILYAWKLDKRNSELHANVNTLQKEASAHVEKLYQSRLEAEGRINLTLNEASQTMETVAEVAEELKKSVQQSSEGIKNLQHIGATNQEIGRELKVFLQSRREQ